MQGLRPESLPHSLTAGGYFNEVLTPKSERDVATHNEAAISPAVT
jgi:hypothetical protein